MLVFHSVSKSFNKGGFALKAASFTVPRGCFCVLLGPSGAGKSTLLRTVNGLVTPDSGQVHVDGTEVTRHSLRRLRPRIGMVHQHFNLTPRLNAATNILCGALPALPTWRALTGLFPQATKNRALHLSEALGLEAAQLAQRAERLSGGQQQRVGIARAFMLDPLVILADEPVASLDPALSVQILSLIRDQAARTGATVLCSLHQVDLARRFADRIVGLADGEIVIDSAPAEISESDIARLYAAESRHG